MAGYLAGRLALTLLTVFLALTFMFGVLHMAGDPVLLLVPVDSSAEHIERMRVEWGFADPLWVQYGRFLGRALAKLAPLMAACASCAPGNCASSKRASRK